MDNLPNYPSQGLLTPCSHCHNYVTHKDGCPNKPPRPAYVVSFVPTRQPAKLSIDTRFWNLHQHYKVCLAGSCPVCQNYLEALVQKQQQEDCSDLIKDLKGVNRTYERLEQAR